MFSLAALNWTVELGELLTSKPPNGWFTDDLTGENHLWHFWLVCTRDNHPRLGVNWCWATPKNRPEFTHQLKKISKSFQFGWGQSSLQSSNSGIRCTQVWQIHVTHLYSVGYNYVYVTCPPLEHYLTGPVQNCQDVLGRAFNSCWELWFIFGQISSNFLDF